MCTRFYIEKDNPAFITMAQALKHSPLYNRFTMNAGKMVKSYGEIYPTDVVPVLAPNKDGKPCAYPMCWGVHMADGTVLFNARSESAAVKPFFKEDWQRRRCIVPASFYYEWRHGKNQAEALPGQNSFFHSNTDPDPGKYAIQPAGSTMTWLCGLYRFENELPYFVILTRQPEGDLKKIHDRMPLILPQEKIKEWISPLSDPSNLLSCSLTDMVFEKVE